jgi:SAM-dependent methyltransferase
MPKLTLAYMLQHAMLIGAAEVAPRVVLPDGTLKSRLKRRAARTTRDAGIAIGRRFGGAFYQDTPDRTVLECTILPFYQLSEEHERLLFIGCDWYTYGYQRLFRLKRLTTIDPALDRARFGAESHQIAPMKTMGGVCPPGSVDAIICNGIIGWGLDDLAEAEESFEAAFTALRPGGHLIIGWNDLEGRRPFVPRDVKALKAFEPLKFPGIGVAELKTPGEIRHVYNFYQKPST